MDFLFYIGGFIIMIMLLHDFSMTVFMPKGAGFITESVTGFVTAVLKLLTGNDGSKKILDYKALIIIIAMVLSWIILTWVGITLIYAGDNDSIIKANTLEPSTFKEKVYFTGSTISTLGLGDYQPHGTFWQWFTGMVSLLGFMIVTICITYIVPVINNLIEKNVLSLRIASIGESTSAILNNGYNGKDFSQLSSEFTALANLIFQYAKNHGAYPILHHVHNSDKNENTILKLASLDEACTILLYHVPADKCLQEQALQQLRRSLTYYLISVRGVDPAEEAPPLPDFEEISGKLGMELNNTNRKITEKIYEKLSLRRRWFKGLIEDDGFSWGDQKGQKFKTELEAGYSEFSV